MLDKLIILVISQDICHVQGECQDGYHVNHLGASSYLECQSACLDNDNCNYFTFNELNNFCLLLYNCTGIDSSSCPDCYTGQQDCVIQSQDVCNVQGECRDGYHIDHSGASSYLECQSACLNTNECNYFTFNEPNDFCLLLYNCTGIDDTNCPDCFTGQKDCQICEQPGECEGNIIDNSFTPTVEDCEKQCFNNVDCNWYTYGLTFEYCLLTSDCTPKNSSNANVFGQKFCYQDNTDSNPSKYQ